MRVLLSMLTIVLLTSCSSHRPTPAPAEPQVRTVTKDRGPEWDAFHDETFSRWDSRRLLKVTGHPVVHCYQGDSQKALTEFKKSFSVKGNDPLYWLHLGNCYAQDGKWDKAEFFYRLSLDHAKTNKAQAMAKNNLALIYLRWEQWEEGNNLLKEAIRLAPEFKVPKYNLSQVYLQFRLYSKAISLLEDPVFRRKKDPDVYYSLANAYFFNGDLKKAGAYFQRIPKDDLTRPEIAASYSLYLIETGDSDGAKKVIEGRAISSTPALEKIIRKIESTLHQKREVVKSRP